jgi:hypothetical protein
MADSAAFARRGARLVLAAMGCAVLIVLSAQGYQNALRNTADLQTAAQYVMTIAQFGYSALGPLVVLLRVVALRFDAGRWLRAAWCAWVVSFIATVGLIPWAWIAPSVPQTFGFALAAIAVSVALHLGVISGTRPISPSSLS